MPKQVGLQPEEYSRAMFQELESVDDDKIMAFENIKLNKEKVSRSYNKKVKRKQFVEGDIVWKAILPKDPRFSKWSPNWEGLTLLAKLYIREHIRESII